MRLYSVKQVSDVILVHDENVLMDPPADETLGFYPLVSLALGLAGWPPGCAGAAEGAACTEQRQAHLLEYA